MSIVPLSAQLQAASSLLDLARRLGSVCLDQGGRIGDLAADPRVKAIHDNLEAKVAAIDEERWMRAWADADFTDVAAADGVSGLIELASAYHPLEYQAVLRGLCHRVLPRLYLAAEAQVPLDRGVPVPFATRPVHRLFEAATPYQGTLGNGHVLEDLRFRLFEHSVDGAVRVVLDFSQRERLDELTWTGARRLPRIATLHPFLGRSAIGIDEENDSWFFGVHPAKWSLEDVLSQLRKVSGAEIALMPELSLPAPDALERALATDPDSYPALIVAGSAHVRERHPTGQWEIRANESRVYIDGRQVGVHRKVHPFVDKGFGGDDRRRTRREGITKETKTITVLSGEHTRLAVAICADLNDEAVPSLLEEAGVNLLLVPTLTTDPGAFNGTIGALASRCQGVSVVANAALDPQPTLGGASPFLVMVAVPRPKPEEQTRCCEHAPGSAPSLAIVDPNRPLADAIRWIS